jgi:hypothetical protein
VSGTPKTYDGVAELSRVTGLPRADILSIWAEAKANVAKLDTCPRHRFTSTPVKLGDKFICLACGGTVGLTDLGNYIRGYRAHGGDADDIWPGWATRHDKKEMA